MLKISDSIMWNNTIQKNMKSEYGEKALKEENLHVELNEHGFWMWNEAKRRKQNGIKERYKNESLLEKDEKDFSILVFFLFSFFWSITLWLKKNMWKRIGCNQIRFKRNPWNSKNKEQT